MTISLLEPARAMPLQSTISPTINGQHQLRLQGEIEHPHWVAFLFSGLSQLKVSVISGFAISEAASDWKAQFNLDFQRSDADPEQVDFLALAERETTLAFQSPQLSDFQITRRLDQGLEVLLHGPDQIGFLGRMLVKVSLLALFPSEMEINTVAGRIRDRVVLRGIAGLPPNPAVEESLDSMLRGLVKSG